MQSCVRRWSLEFKESDIYPNEKDDVNALCLWEFAKSTEGLETDLTKMETDLMLSFPCPVQGVPIGGACMTGLEI